MKLFITCAKMVININIIIIFLLNSFIQITLYHECYFNSTDLNIDSTNVKLERQKNLVCSMIMISENATLKDSNNIELNLCHNCDKQECQDVILMKQKYFSFVI